MSVSAATVAHLQHTAPRAGGAGARSWVRNGFETLRDMLVASGVTVTVTEDVYASKLAPAFPAPPPTQV